MGLDIKGHRFGRLTAVSPSGEIANNTPLWRCACDCGNEAVIRKTELPRTKSCGKCRAAPADIAPTDAAWAAGIFDGEGCVIIQRRKLTNNKTPWYYLRTTVSNTHLPTLETLMRAFRGSISRAKKRTGHLQCWAWQLSNKQAESFLRTIEQYAVTKRRQIEIALDFRAIPRRGKYRGATDADVAKAIWCKQELAKLKGGQGKRR